MDNQLKLNENSLDQEWVNLILDALDMGMTVSDIKEFFTKNKRRSNFI